MLAPTRLLLVSFVVVLSMAFTACGGGPTRIPDTSPAPIAGSPASNNITPAAIGPGYSGTETIGGVTFPAAVSVTANGSQITGTWGNSFNGLVNAGTLSGTYSGSNFTATVTPADPTQCAVSVNGVFNGPGISGSFSTVPGCASPQSGGFNMTGTGGPMMMGGGHLSGALHDNLYGPGTMSVSVTQNGVILAGTFSDSFGLSGLFDGVMVGPTVYFNLLPNNPGACPFSATGTLSGNTVAGNYTTMLCGVADSGTFSMTL